ncbi:MAG: TIR domain-containing protein [Anaerolineae bacterium]|nr:TIR domain-containing protein [Anaerolineae bacterium]
MSDVFISYSRLDKEFVGKLRDALEGKAQNVWIDWESIPPSQSWWSEIQKGIAHANNFAVVISPSSMASPICQLEIEHALKLGKRVIPILHLDFDRAEAVKGMAGRLADPAQDATRQLWGDRQPHALLDANMSVLKHINYFFFRPEDEFETRFEDLFTVIRTDYAHKEQHTTLELRATEWERRGHDPSFLLLDEDLEVAQDWLAQSGEKEPAPTDLQRRYIQASEKRTRQLRNIRWLSIGGSITAVVAIVFAIGALLTGIQAIADADAANLQVAVLQPTLTAGEARVADSATQVAQGEIALAAATRVSQQVATNERILVTATQVAQQVISGGETLAAVPPTLTQAAVIAEDANEQLTIALGVGDSALLLIENQTINAVGIMDAIVVAYPEQPLAYIGRALILKNAGEFERAILDLTQAIALNPDDPVAYNYRGITY